MIVKDEADRLPQCLASVKEVVDQVVVVDTGSSDRTVEIAESYGAQVHHFEWCDDFAAARNESLRHAVGDWVLWMDADEQLEPNQVPRLVECLTAIEEPVCYRVTIRSPQRGGVHHDSDAHRLFTNHFGIRFEGRIHEQVAPSARRIGAVEKAANFHLLHHGYALDPENMSLKVQRNRELLKRCLADEPDNAYYHFTLAQNYNSTGDDLKALSHYERALTLRQFEPSMEASLLNCAAQTCFKLGMVERAEELSKRSLELVPIQSGAVYNLYKLAERRGETAEVIRLLTQLLDNARRLETETKRISTDTVPPMHRILTSLGNSQLNAGDKDAAFDSFAEACTHPGCNEVVLPVLIQLGTELERLPAVRGILEEAVRREVSPARLDLLGITHIKLREFERAAEVYEHLRLLIPDDPQVIRRLAGLYAKLGRVDKAATLLAQGKR